MRAATVALLLSCCAPAAPAPLGPAPSAPVAPSASPPEAARWLIAGSPPPARAELRLASGEVLQIGEQGRRWVVERSGGAKHAHALAPVELVDVRADEGGVLALGGDGSTFAMADPLGPLAQRSPPAGAARYAFGAKALLGVTGDGVVVRAAAPGAEWSRTPLGLRRGERVIDLATDRRGRVAVLLAPQRLLVSIDDGVSFRRVPLVGIGARGLSRDAAGDLWLHGRTRPSGEPMRVAKLAPDGSKLVVEGTQAPLAEVTLLGAATWQLAGQRAVLLTTEARDGAWVTTLAVGARPDKLGTPQLLTNAPPDRVEAVGHEAHVTLALVRERQVELVETSDDGATLRRTATFDRRPYDEGRVLLAAGPGGFLLTRPLCREGACAAQVRVGKQWRALPRDLEPAAVAVGEDRAYLTTLLGGRLHELSLDAGSLVDTKLLLGAVLALSVDSAGHLLAVEGPAKRIARIVERRIEGYVPIPGAPTDAAFAGQRGVVLTSDEGAFETADGGAHWVPIATAGRQAPRCVDGGCSFGEALRAGWDLPARAGAALTVTDPRASTIPPAPALVGRKPPPVDLDCTYGAKWAPLPAVGSGDSLDRRYLLGLAGDTRWLNLVHDDDPAKTRVFFVRGGGAPTTREFVPRGARGRLHQRMGDQGVLRAFFQFGPKRPGAGYSPVDVTLGWLDAATGKVGKGTLRSLPPFYVGTEQLDALLALVAGGVVVLPRTPGAQLHLINLDGRVETYGSPPTPSEPYSRAVRAGKTLVLGAGGRDLELALTSDQGKTWKTAVWSLGESGWLGMAGGVPSVVVWGGAGPLTTFPVGALEGDLPEWTPAERAGPLEPCDPKANTGTPWEHLTAGEARLHLVDARGGAPVVLESQMRFTRGDASGKRCTSALLAYDGNDWNALVAPHDLEHGHVSRKSAKAGFEWTSLSCKGR